MVTRNANKHFEMLATYKILPEKTFGDRPVYSMLVKITMYFQLRGVLNKSELRTHKLDFLSRMFRRGNTILQGQCKALVTNFGRALARGPRKTKSSIQRSVKNSMRLQK